MKKWTIFISALMAFVVMGAFLFHGDSEAGRKTGTLIVKSVDSQGAKVDASITVERKKGKGEMKLSLPPKNYTVKFGELAGYSIKDPKNGKKTVKVTPGKETKVSGVYERVGDETIKMFEVKDAQSPFAVIGVLSTGAEALGVTAEKDENGNPTKITGATLSNQADGSWVSFTLGDDGLPAAYTDSSGYTAKLSNYTANTVDISLYDSKGNLTAGPATTIIDVNSLKSLQSMTLTSSSRLEDNGLLISSDYLIEKSTVNMVEWGFKISGAVGCALGAIAIPVSGPLVPVAALAASMACASAGLDIVNLATGNKAAGFFSKGLDLVSSCGRLNPKECLTSVAQETFSAYAEDTGIVEIIGPEKVSENSTAKYSIKVTRNGKPETVQAEEWTLVSDLTPKTGAGSTVFSSIESTIPIDYSSINHNGELTTKILPVNYNVPLKIKALYRDPNNNLVTSLKTVIILYDESKRKSGQQGDSRINSGDKSSPTGIVTDIQGSYTYGDKLSYSVEAIYNQPLSNMTFLVASPSGKEAYKKLWVPSSRAGESFLISGPKWQEGGMYFYALWVKDQTGQAWEVAKGSFLLKMPQEITIPGAKGDGVYAGGGNNSGGSVKDGGINNGENTANPSGNITGIYLSYVAGNAIYYFADGRASSGLSEMTFAVTDASGAQKYAPPSWYPGGYSASYSGNFSTAGWVAGTYTYSLRVKDKAGKAVEAAKGSFVLKAAPITTTNPGSSNGGSTSGGSSGGSGSGGSTSGGSTSGGSSGGSSSGGSSGGSTSGGSSGGSTSGGGSSGGSTSGGTETSTTPIDTIAPTTTVSPAGGTFTSALNVTLTCSDTGRSGCDKIYHTSDGTDPLTSSTVTAMVSPDTIGVSSNKTIKFYSTDKAGNKEAVRTETYTISDATAPTTTASPAGGSYGSAQSVVLSCSDNSGGSGCATNKTYYTTDGSTPTASSPAYSTAITISSTTTLKFFSVDNSGNSETVKLATYTIPDTTAPTTAASPSSGTFTSTQTITLSCSDSGGSGCAANKTYYTIDGSIPTTASTVYSAAITISSTTTLKFFSVDNAGNSESVRSETYTKVTTSIGGGYFHTLAFKSTGSIWAWGWNAAGQLGDGTTTDRISPVQVATGLTGISAMEGGWSFTVALKNDGTVWAWGNNGAGELGNGSTTNSSSPVQVTSLTGITAIAVGMGHSLALKSDGTVWAWGYNGFAPGLLGDGTTTNRSTPVQVSGLTGVVAIDVGYYHSLALKSDGTVWAWGSNTSGQLGDGSTTSRSTPVQVSGLTGVNIIGAGGTYSLAVKTNGTVWAWGSNTSGELGDGTGTVVGQRLTPSAAATGLTGVTALACAHQHTLALKSDGTVWAWGSNTSGQLGDGSTTIRYSPVQVSGLSSVTAVARGYQFSLALKSDGTVWGWGVGGMGQFGNGTTTNSYTPVQATSF
ncbi:MAG: chitobiase/beta-hexosaminidase C-terminal domain-containing protein [Nitrospinae bacterium]|nr:chitobiase/beta-hexosaminidase C-terminal domain-containing protein [Nitrospinota bacterium]